MSAARERLPIASRTVLAVSGLMVVAMAAALLAMGHSWICACGTVKLFSGTTGVDNSQHILDWYTPSHVVHGFLFYAAAWLVFRRWTVGARFLVALFVEIAWEIVEGTPFLQDRYRGATVAVDYLGDSIVNAGADVLAMVAGFWLAARLPVWASIAAVIAMEIAAAVVIRDNLVLNVLMLLWPIAAIKNWQAGG
jgi:hypothetical protein